LRSLLVIIGFLALGIAAPAHAAVVETQEQWKPRVGDVVVADITSNTIYLVHPDAHYYPSLMASGLQKDINYLGEKYYAQTPVAHWTVKQRMYQIDKTDFGQTGLFLRLYRDGVTKTAYGIHSHKNIAAWLKSPERYKSYGCIVVTESVLALIDQTYKMNGNSLEVYTTNGPDKLIELLQHGEQLAAR
jgi:hypothetical protein